MHHAFQLGEAEHNLELSRAADGYRLHLGERVLAVRLDGAALCIDGRRREVLVATRGDEVFVHLDGQSHRLRYEHPLVRLAQRAQAGADDAIQAPMPGALVAVHAARGDAVRRGQPLLVMESMKMETTIAAPRDGVIAQVHFEKGQTFDRDAVLLTLVALPRAAAEGRGGGGGAEGPAPQSSPASGGGRNS